MFIRNNSGRRCESDGFSSSTCVCGRWEIPTRSQQSSSVQIFFIFPTVFCFFLSSCSSALSFVIFWFLLLFSIRQRIQQYQNGRLDPSTTCYDSPTCYDVAYYFSRVFLFLFKNHFLGGNFIEPRRRRQQRIIIIIIMLATSRCRGMLLL